MKAIFAGELDWRLNPGFVLGSRVYLRPLEAGGPKRALPGLVETIRKFSATWRRERFQPRPGNLETFLR